MNGLFVSNDMDSNRWWKKTSRSLYSAGLLVLPGGRVQSIPYKTSRTEARAYKERIQRILMTIGWTLVGTGAVLIFIIMCIEPAVVVQPAILMDWIRSIR